MFARNSDTSLVAIISLAGDEMFANIILKASESYKTTICMMYAMSPCPGHTFLSLRTMTMQGTMGFGGDRGMPHCLRRGIRGWGHATLPTPAYGAKGAWACGHVT